MLTIPRMACVSLAFLSLTGVAEEQEKEWTFLVYLNADNNLFTFGQRDLAEMEKVGSTDKVNIVVQFDPETRGAPTTRYHVTKNNKPVPGKPTSTVLETMGETDMGDEKVFSDFLIWGAKKYPAKKYAVVVWNHGSGWSGISYDDEPNNHMTMRELRQGFEKFNSYLAEQRRVRRGSSSAMVDLVNFDACLMSTIEVAYELRNNAKIVVGSQFNEPGDGESYTTLLTPLVEKPQMEPREFAKHMVRDYVQSYASRSEINYLAVDLTKLRGFTDSFETMSKALHNAPSEVQQKIRKGLSSGSHDLLKALQSIHKNGSEDQNVKTRVETVMQTYGYPSENFVADRMTDTEEFTITRPYAAVVQYRTSKRSKWKSVELQANGTGMYVARIPAYSKIQYVVTPRNSRSDSITALREATSEVAFRRDGEAIVYHDNFPDISPLIADAYSQSTVGAHGMTLYSMAGITEGRGSRSRRDTASWSNYLELQFATEGAPSWTSFFRSVRRSADNFRTAFNN